MATSGSNPETAYFIAIKELPQRAIAIIKLRVAVKFISLISMIFD